MVDRVLAFPNGCSTVATGPKSVALRSTRKPDASLTCASTLSSEEEQRAWSPAPQCVLGMLGRCRMRTWRSCAARSRL
jgi:hypothetical protein